MITFLCIVVWLLIGFALTRLLFKISKHLDQLSLCAVAVLTCFGPIILMPLFIELIDNCPKQDFFSKRK